MFLKFNTLAICFLVLFSSFINILCIDDAFSEVYYITPSGGSDSNPGTSHNTPWATFSKARSVLAAGDTLYLMDGTYTTANSGMLHWYNSQGAPSGTSGNPITIKALNDGQALVDGQDSNRPFHIWGQDPGGHISYIDVEGIRFGNSNTDCFVVRWGEHINVRRVSVFDADHTVNSTGMVAWTSTNVLFEDCAVYGDGRTLISPFDSDNVTIRRCWMDWTAHSGAGGPSWGMQVYGSDGCIIENNIVRSDATNDFIGGFAVWAHTYNASADNNKFYGNIAQGNATNDIWYGFWIGSAERNLTGNEYHNNVAFDNAYGLWQRAGDSLVVRKHTVINSVRDSIIVDYGGVVGEDPDYIVSGTYKNSSVYNSSRDGMDLEPHALVGKVISDYNNINASGESNWEDVSNGTNSISISPSYNTATYGNGAYLMAPTALKGHGEGGADIGAEILYRYEDGVLTNQQLWPWPMEDRIVAETGISVTWEANGGIWKTLEGVYSYTPLRPPLISIE